MFWTIRPFQIKVKLKTLDSMIDVFKKFSFSWNHNGHNWKWQTNSSKRQECFHVIKYENASNKNKSSLSNSQAKPFSCNWGQTPQHSKKDSEKKKTVKTFDLLRIFLLFYILRPIVQKGHCVLTRKYFACHFLSSSSWLLLLLLPQPRYLLLFAFVTHHPQLPSHGQKGKLMAIYLTIKKNGGNSRRICRHKSNTQLKAPFSRLGYVYQTLS